MSLAEKAAQCFCAIVLLIQLLWVAVLSTMIHYEKYPTRDTSNLNYVSQVANDWSQQPFTGIFATSNTTCPAQYPHEVVYDFWPGATIFCDCIDVTD